MLKNLARRMRTPTGVIRHTTPGVPADAPATLRGETPWFSGAHKPVQPGLYKRLSFSGLVQYSFFDGGAWLWSHRDAGRAAQAPADAHSLVQDLPWCGLVAPPLQGYGPTPAAGQGGAA